LIEPDTWYVSYHLDSGSGHYARRATRRFKSEADAKQFAHKMISDGYSAYAGTINPYTPKMVISSKRIQYWIAELE
jgi:hypothetical protein